MDRFARITSAKLMQTYFTRKEHKAAGDSEPVTIRGGRYMVVMPPVFEDHQDPAGIKAVLIDESVALKG